MRIQDRLYINGEWDIPPATIVPTSRSGRGIRGRGARARRCLAPGRSGAPPL